MEQIILEVLIILFSKLEDKAVRKRAATTYTVTAAITVCMAVLCISAMTNDTKAIVHSETDMVTLSDVAAAQSNEDSIEKTVELPVTEEESITVGITRSYLSGNFEPLAEASIEDLSNPGTIQTDDLAEELSITNISNTLDAQEKEKLEQEKAEILAIAEKAEQEKIEAETARKLAESKARLTGILEGVDAPDGYLLAISNPDTSYSGRAIALTADDRWVAERLVMGEAGNQGFVGAALVAQCIRDAMVNDGYSTVESVRTSMGYSGKLTFEPNQNVIDAVTYIFDQGKSAVQHRILYFYSSNGGWHETQNFIVQVGAHRFFDRWY